jgi:hypothetical protein
MKLSWDYMVVLTVTTLLIQYAKPLVVYFKLVTVALCQLFDHFLCHPSGI